MTTTPRSHRSKSTLFKKIDNQEFGVWRSSSCTEALLKFLEQEKLALQNSRSRDYDKSSWAYNQADINGGLAIIKKIEDLLHK